MHYILIALPGTSVVRDSIYIPVMHETQAANSVSAVLWAWITHNFLAIVISKPIPSSS